VDKHSSALHLTLAEAADVLGVGPEQVRRLAAAGRLPSSRDSRGSYRIAADAAAALAQERLRAPRRPDRLRRVEQRLEALEARQGLSRTPSRPAAGEDLLAEVARLRAENTRLKETETSLAAAAAAEHEAADALADALAASARAEAARSRAAAAYEAALAAYRRPGQLDEL